MIPVIGIPYISEEPLLLRLLDSIPDDLYEEIHIIDNSRGELHEGTLSFKPRLHITKMRHNAGVSASWNTIIKLHPLARWWCLLNADVVLDRENIEKLINGMKIHELCYLNGMAAFGIRSSCVGKVGWFDENYVPAYCEDIDFDYRCRLLGVHIETVGKVVEHFGSATIKGNPHYQRENGRSYPANRKYYERKWGGFVGEETHTTPFGQGGSPRDWTLEMSRLVAQTWKEQ